MGAKAAERQAAISIAPVRRKPVETSAGRLPVTNDSIQTRVTSLLLQTGLGLVTQAACR
jgi:hypothetical protein